MLASAAVKHPRRSRSVAVTPDGSGLLDVFPLLSRLLRIYLRTAGPQDDATAETRAFVRWLYDHVELTGPQEDLLVSLRLQQTGEFHELRQQLSAQRTELSGIGNGTRCG